MLRTITKPTVYVAGPEVFNTRRDDQAYMKAWGERHAFEILHPGRHSSAIDQTVIFPNCRRDARNCDVIILDLNDFRGKNADEGVCVELGMALSSGAVLLGYKEKKEDPVARHGPPRPHGDQFVDENGYFIELGSDRNLMVNRGVDAMFYGPREEVLERIAKYINTNVKGWYRHEDPLLGRKLLPPDTVEVFETIPPNFNVDLTRFRAVVAHPKVRRLREIKQLGALFWIFPGATHTRYEHSVMTLKFTYDALHHLRLDEEEKKHILAYALLHDLGHTPYSHELEEITNLDQMEAAKKMIQEESFAQALRECDIDLETLLTFFDKKNPLRKIVSDKVLGTDKLAYLFRDGLATGKGGYDNIEMLLQHTVFENGVLGVDERAAESALKQIILYHSTYAATYFGVDARLSQRIFTLLGQIGMDTGVLPPNWHELNDVWFDHHMILAEQTGNGALKKLGRDGIVKQAYQRVGSLVLPGAEILEEAGTFVAPITEEEYARFLKNVPVRERRALEERLCEEAGVEPLDILIAPGGKLGKLKIDDTLVFRNSQEGPVRLLADMHPGTNTMLEYEAKRKAVTVRFYARKECKERVEGRIERLVARFRQLAA